MKAEVRPVISNSLLLGIIIGLMAALALFRELYFFPRLDISPNTDNSWLIYAASRLADGQKLYTDILETNPPLAVWLNLLPVWMGRIFSISPLLVFPVLVTALNLVSLWLAAKIMRFSAANHIIFYSLLLYTACGFFLFSSIVYGERELLFIAMVLPCLVKSLLGKEEQWQFYNNHKILDLLVIILAAVGFAIKPFFLILWGLNELHKAISSRSFITIFSRDNWLIGIFQLIYFSAIYFFTPEYFKIIVPVILSTYFTFEVPWQQITAIIGYITAPPLVLILMARPDGYFRKIIMRAVTWMFACAMLIVLQRKEWPNHIYPMAFMAGLILVMLVIYLLKLPREKNISSIRFSALCLGVFIIAAASCLNAKFWFFIHERPSVIHTKLLEEIDKRASGKYVYPLAFNMQSGFPVIAWSHGIFHGGFSQLWPLPGILTREQQHRLTPDIVSARQFFYDSLVKDFSDYPPELVWVENNISWEKVIGTADYDDRLKNRSLTDVLTRDARFAALWQGYKKIGNVEGESGAESYSLYERIKK